MQTVVTPLEMFVSILLVAAVSCQAKLISNTSPAGLDPGTGNTCIRFPSATAKCFGGGNLGYSTPPSSMLLTNLPNLDFGANSALTLASGFEHSCALLSDKNVQCWGANGNGQLGYGRVVPTPFALPTGLVVELLGPAAKISAGGNHTCVVLEDLQVACWGSGSFGQLGYNSTVDVGLTTPVLQAGSVQFGPSVGATQISCGESHTCAVLTSLQASCWGNGADGRLGHRLGNRSSASPAAVALPPSASALQVSAGGAHSCALLDDLTLRCWGKNREGQLGYGTTQSVSGGGGASGAPTIASVGAVPLGGSGGALQVSAGASHTCALLTDLSVKCWGLASSGQLGYGSVQSLSLPAAAPLSIGAPAMSVAAGTAHTCAATVQGQLFCWGDGSQRQLGYGNTASVGAAANSTPASAGPVPLPMPLQFAGADVTMMQCERLGTAFTSASLPDCPRSGPYALRFRSSVVAASPPASTLAAFVGGRQCDSTTVAAAVLTCLMNSTAGNATSRSLTLSLTLSSNATLWLIPPSQAAQVGFTVDAPVTPPPAVAVPADCHDAPIETTPTQKGIITTALTIVLAATVLSGVASAAVASMGGPQQDAGPASSVQGSYRVLVKIRTNSTLNNIGGVFDFFSYCQFLVMLSLLHGRLEQTFRAFSTSLHNMAFQTHFFANILVRINGGVAHPPNPSCLFGIAAYLDHFHITGASFLGMTVSGVITAWIMVAGLLLLGVLLLKIPAISRALRGFSPTELLWRTQGVYLQVFELCIFPVVSAAVYQITSVGCAASTRTALRCGQAGLVLLIMAVPFTIVIITLRRLLHTPTADLERKQQLRYSSLFRGLRDDSRLLWLAPLAINVVAGVLVGMPTYLTLLPQVVPILTLQSLYLVYLLFFVPYSERKENWYHVFNASLRTVNLACTLVLFREEEMGVTAVKVVSLLLFAINAVVLSAFVLLRLSLSLLHTSHYLRMRRWDAELSEPAGVRSDRAAEIELGDLEGDVAGNGKPVTSRTGGFIWSDNAPDRAEQL